MQRKFSFKDVRKSERSEVRKDNNSSKELKSNNTVTGSKIICPPPTDVDILKVLKVFEECRLVDTNNVIDRPDAPVGAVDVECLGAELIAPPCCEINPDNNTITTTFSFVTAYQFLDADGDPIGDVQVVETLDETRTVFLSRAGESGLDCQVDIFLDCFQCFVSETDSGGVITQVTCCVGKQILFKLIALVQLRIPTLGYAPEPPDCEEVAGECPEFKPVWPPYPPQPTTKPATGSKKCGCNK